MWNPFKRKNYASPYYGKGNRALFSSPPVTPQLPQTTAAPIEKPKPVAPAPIHPDWEQRRFELVKMLVGQDRRSVVLGKLRASNKTIATNARKLADAAIRELMNNPYDSHDGEREETDERGGE